MLGAQILVSSHKRKIGDLTGRNGHLKSIGMGVEGVLKFQQGPTEGFRPLRAALCAEELPLSIIVKTSLSGVFSDGRNDYSIFNEFEGKHGVYIFKSREGGILYVGEARKQDLKKRITQNFKESDTGGTFRKNYIASEDGGFDEFKELVGEGEIFFVVAPDGMSGMIIRALESLLIHFFKPKYNIDRDEDA